MKTESQKINKTGAPFAECALIGLVLVYALLYIKIQNGWWFEDDPGQYLIAMRQPSPLCFFYTRELAQSAGNAVTPFLLSSLWLDAWLAPRSVVWAYMHQLIALVLTTVLLFELAAQVFKNRTPAFVFAAGWILLPSTQAVFQFISARHYLEGMLVSAAGLLMLLKGLDTPEGRHKRTAYLIAACTLLGLSLLFKEIYALATWPAFFMICLWKRRFRLAGICVVIAIFYAVYRYWAAGASLSYGMPLLGWHQWLKTVSHMPYMLTANSGGYLALLLASGAAGYGLYTKRAKATTVIIFAGFIAVTACSLYPIAFALNFFWHAPGTYYRAPFLLNTVLWLFCVWALFKLPRPITLLGFLILTFPLACGCDAARNFWTAEKTRYEQEGKIYLSEGGNKLIYSELPAWWYLNDLANLFNAHNLHYIAARRPDKTENANILKNYRTIWRFRAGRLVEDQPLYLALVKEMRSGRN